MAFISRLIWVLASLVIGALLLRFIFMLFGADPFNEFVNFIYDFTRPLIAPFVGIFGERDAISGRGQFELATLVAIAIYTVIASLITRLFAPTRR